MAVGKYLLQLATYQDVSLDHTLVRECCSPWRKYDKVSNSCTRTMRRSSENREDAWIRVIE